MFAVGRLGSYISRGVNTVSGPFGGAVDIIVVEQPDGSYKSSPWYVRFGKSQGVLDPSESVASINVNGVDADFHMYLDNKGEAYFLREVDAVEGESEMYSSGDEMDSKSDIWRNPKSKSYNFDSNRRDLVSEVDKGKIVPRTNSPRARFFGLPFGRRSKKETGFREEGEAVGVDHVTSLERAEIAANLLDVRWTTNIGPSKDGSSKIGHDEDKVNASLVHQSNSASDDSGCEPSVSNPEGTNEGIPCSTIPGDIVTFGIQDTHNGVDKSPRNCDCASGPNDEFISEEVHSCINDYRSEGNTNATTSEISEDEQFSFSDLDEPKVEEAEKNKCVFSDGKKACHPEDSSRVNEEELIETVTKDDKLHQLPIKPLQSRLLTVNQTPKVKFNNASSPINIVKAQNNVDLEFLAPVVESLPNMPFVGDNINPDGTPELLSRSLDSNFEALNIVNDEVQMLSESCQQVESALSTTDSSHISEEIKKIISDPAVEVSLCRHLLYEGMGYEPAACAFDAEKLDTNTFFSRYPDILKDDKLVVRIGGLYFPWDAALPIAATIGSHGTEQILEPKGMIAVGQDNKTFQDGSQKCVNAKNGSWKIWPFSYSRSNSVNENTLGSETSQGSMKRDGNGEVAGFEVMKKKKRAKTPTSEQLESLNLQEGKNVVKFTFSTVRLGTQQVDARIFLWKWNTRIVISDVDGTITKSDVLGQFMPLMGYDWSQTGVTRLFSAIKANGYHLLFLSARSISQAYLTRQFLVNLKQDGKPLPEGPIVISPDGLFPSLYREVIRRAPHEFKIACLSDIRALFPQDHSPFYAGFGNRDTDEFSYLKVGIPRGKIFTINPKGQVVVNRRVDTKSYTSLHDLVHDMFPPTTVTEQEDYNSWNFWRLPPPDVGI